MISLLVFKTVSVQETKWTPLKSTACQVGFLAETAIGNTGIWNPEADLVPEFPGGSEKQDRNTGENYLRPKIPIRNFLFFMFMIFSTTPAGSRSMGAQNAGHFFLGFFTLTIWRLRDLVGFPEMDPNFKHLHWRNVLRIRNVSRKWRILMLTTVVHSSPHMNHKVDNLRDGMI